MSIDSMNSNPKNILANNKNSQDDCSLNKTDDGLKIRNLETEIPREKALTNLDQDHHREMDINQSEEISKLGGGAFVFDSSPLTVRFTWTTNALGYLCEVSEVLSQTIGPYALRIIGMQLSDINKIFLIDPENHFPELLKQKNTWHGARTFWPIEGTDFNVPIDLSALPIYSRNREFNGFKGFGIIHVNQSSIDPHQLGRKIEEQFSIFLTKGKDKSSIEQEIIPSLPSPKTSNSIAIDNPDAQDRPTYTDQWSKKYSADYLNLKSKIALLSNHYLKKNKYLKPTITSSLPNNELYSFSQNNSFHTIDLNQDMLLKQNYSPKDMEDENSLCYSHPSLSACFGKGEDLKAENIDKYPIAFLVYSNGSLFYANPSFLLLTGYKDLAEVENAGGLSALLDTQQLPGSNKPLGSVTLYCADRTDVAVSAHLHTVRWHGNKALAMTFVPFEKIKDSSEEPSHQKEGQYPCEKTDTHKIEVMQLHSILEAASDGITIIDSDGIILSINHAMSTLFGYDPKDILEKPFTILFARENHKMMDNYLLERISCNTDNKRELTSVGCTKQGKLIFLRVTINKLPFSTCCCLIFRDISEWQEERNKLSDARKIAEEENSHKSDFLACVSHEIRTPLTSIIGFSEVIKNQKFGPIGNPRYIEYADYIERSGNLVLDIVNDLLDISKIKSGKMTFNFENISLNEAISEAISLIRLYANEKRILIRTSFSNNTSQIFADLRSIKQIALNILSNAIHFTPSGGQIIISTSCINDKGVVLHVRDTGIGMTHGELEQAKKPFGQIPNTEQMRGAGTGLGLPLIKTMVDANKGKLSIMSTPLKGTLIEIIFPASKTDPAQYLI
ncbi:MAG: PAS domain S-box protein [Candidatus Liberibacter ctenarytainae]|uniref:histidine kinase n=1 Tax=Candidatus Liberibacter ctenarytainae TaxID=2020335 RepID=A0A937AEJ0_9HYPH|nr:PAS domain S-box protein [Candidatus Liberibacter ctenarytainae]